MANPSGVNQFLQQEPAYGDVKRQTELMREAPISGAPVSGRALNTPGRLQDQAVASQPSPPQSAAVAAPPQGAPPAGAQPQTPYYQQVAKVWQSLAAVPGASEQVKEYAKLAVEDASRG